MKTELAEMRPAPTEEEAAVIVAAVESHWPRVGSVEPEAGFRRNTSWRFSGRWWSRPVPTRRDRPFR